MNIAGKGIPGSPDPWKELADLKKKLGAEVSRRQLACSERDRLAERVAELEQERASSPPPPPASEAQLRRERDAMAEECKRLRRNAEEGELSVRALNTKLEGIEKEWKDASEFVGAVKRTADEQKARADALEESLEAATGRIKELESTLARMKLESRGGKRKR